MSESEIATALIITGLSFLVIEIYWCRSKALFPLVFSLSILVAGVIISAGCGDFNGISALIVFTIIIVMQIVITIKPRKYKTKANNAHDFVLFTFELVSIHAPVVGATYQ